jgi:DNA-binding response OmpR family regulator
VSDYVLIADDDPLVVEVITEFLNLMGIECRAVQNGREALEMIRRDRPKAIILDLLMPLVNGFSTLTQLAKEHGTPIPVIVLSGLADQVSVVQRLPGVVGTMVKGRFTLAELQALLTAAGVLEDPAKMTSRRLPAPSSAVRQTGPLPLIEPSAATSKGKTGPLRALPETAAAIQGDPVAAAKKSAEASPVSPASATPVPPKPGE